MLAQLLPILGVIFTFGTPALIVALLLRNNQRRARLLHETIGKMIDAGRDIPPDLFDALNPEPSANVSLYRGIILCGAGLGLGLAALIMSSSALAALCLIAVSVGLAFLLIWKLEKSERT